MLSSAWLLARKDIAILARRRDVLLWLLVMPVAFIFLVGTAGRRGSASVNAGGPKSFALVGVVDNGFLTQELVRRLNEQGLDVVRPSRDEEGLFPRRLKVSDADGNPAHLTQALLAGDAVTVTLTLPSNDLAAPRDRFRVARALYSLANDLELARGRQDLSPDALAALVQEPRPVQLRARMVDEGEAAGFPHAVSGIMVMFTLLVLITYGGTLLVTEREQGLLRRLASAPLTRGEVVLGKWIAQMMLATCQIVVVIVIGATVFDASWGSRWLAALGVIFTWAGLCSAFSLLLGTLARSRAQMSGLGVMVSMGLAALGGCWWPPEMTPAWMQRVGALVPTGWVMGALRQLASPGDGVLAVVPHLSAMLLFTFGCGWLGARLFRFRNVD